WCPASFFSSCLLRPTMSLGVYRAFFFFSSRRRHTISKRDWSSDVCSSDLGRALQDAVAPIGVIQIDPSGHLSPAALSGSPALGDDEHRRRRGPDTRDPQRGRPLSRLADTLTGIRPADGQLIRQTPRLLRLSSPPCPRRPPPALPRRLRPPRRGWSGAGSCPNSSSAADR